MILLKRALPLLLSITILVLGEAMVARGTLFWYAAIVLTAVHCSAYAYLLSSGAAKQEALFFFSVATTLLASGLFLAVYLSSTFQLHALVILMAFLYGWYTENIFHYLYQQTQYQPYSLEHISSYLNVLSFFFFFAGLFASRVYLAMTLAALLLIGAIAIVFFTFLMSWGNKLRVAETGVFSLVHLFVLIELFGILSLLPTSFFVSSLLLTVPHYLMANLARHAVRGTLKRPVLMRYLTVSLSTFLLTLLTAPWT